MLTGELTNSNFASQPLNSITPQVVGCSRCRSRIETTAKFCGNCGAPQAQKTLPPGTGRSLVEDLSQVSLRLSEADIEASNRLNKEQAQKAKAQAMPSFARKKSRRIAPELREEMNTIYMMMIREKFFLAMHCVIFLVINLIGFFIAFKCYFEYIGDEVTKIMVATTPLLFINLVALTCLVPIKGTKKELARLKERETYIKLRLEYDSVMEV